MSKSSKRQFKKVNGDCQLFYAGWAPDCHSSVDFYPICWSTIKREFIIKEGFSSGALVGYSANDLINNAYLEIVELPKTVTMVGHRITMSAEFLRAAYPNFTKRAEEFLSSKNGVVITGRLMKLRLPQREVRCFAAYAIDADCLAAYDKAKSEEAKVTKLQVAKRIVDTVCENRLFHQFWGLYKKKPYDCVEGCTFKELVDYIAMYRPDMVCDYNVSEIVPCDNSTFRFARKIDDADPIDFSRFIENDEVDYKPGIERNGCVLVEVILKSASAKIFVKLKTLG